MATQLILVLFQAANGVITARLLGPRGKGLYAICLLITSVLYLIMTFNIQGALTYFAGRNQYSKSSLFSFACLGALLISLLPAMALPLIPQSKLDLIVPGFSWGLWGLACIVFPFIIFTNFLSGLLLGWLMINELNIIKLVQGTTCLLLTISLLIFLKRTPRIAVISYGLSLLVSAGFFIFYLTRCNISLTTDIPGAMVKQGLIYSAKGYAGNLFQFFNYRFDVFLVNYFLTPNQVGLYTVAVSAGELLWHFPNSIAGMLFSTVAREHGRYSTQKVAMISRITCLMTACAITVLIPCGRGLITVLFGKVFAGAFPSLEWLLPGIFFLGMSKVLTGYFNGNGHPQYGTYSSIISFIVMLGADLFLIPRYGINGAAIGSSLSYICASAVVVYFFLRQTGAPFMSLLAAKRSDISLVLGTARSLCRR